MVENENAAFATLAWTAADCLGKVISAIDNKRNDSDWLRKYGDIADKILNNYDEIRDALRDIGLRHDRGILARWK